jgi:hypothetical protein
MTNNPTPPRIPPRRPPTIPVPPLMAPKLPAVEAAPAAPMDAGEPIIALGSGEYRFRRYLMTLLLVAGGVWFAYDGWKGWPAENQQIADLSHQMVEAEKAGNHDLYESINGNSLTHKTPHTDLDIRWQKNLAVALPICGLLFLVWTLFNSRGAYQLQGGTLSVPGHPPVQLTEITEVDGSKWDRKGIAYIQYKAAGGATGKLRLDDFVYQQDPTDEIFKRIQAALGISLAPAPVPSDQPQ